MHPQSLSEVAYNATDCFIHHVTYMAGWHLVLNVKVNVPLSTGYIHSSLELHSQSSAPVNSLIKLIDQIRYITVQHSSHLQSMF